MNTTERKVVEVLAILDMAARYAQSGKAINPQTIDEARAAVAGLIERERIMREALQRIARHTKNITGAPDMVAIAENGLALAARVQGGQ